MIEIHWLYFTILVAYIIFLTFILATDWLRFKAARKEYQFLLGTHKTFLNKLEETSKYYCKVMEERNKEKSDE